MSKDATSPLPKTKLRAAIIVGILLANDDHELLHDDLDELESLLMTLGIRTQARVIQRRQKLTAKCLLGEGKVDEIRAMATTVAANLVVFDRPLSPPQVRNLERMTGCEILDRTGVIFEIFARHGRSAQAKAQVEIAQLEYLLPRMTGAWTHLQRQKGRGDGEKQIEMDRRRARDKIGRLQKQLEGMRKERLTQRKARRNEIKVALVGYTNSGKTTVMNALTRANLQAADVLFATLDSSVRSLDPSTRPKILLSDTVGFIRNLPHGLVESFRSTLDEVLEADLLLHVVDVSHKKYQAQIEATRQVLHDIGAADIPLLMVFNKMDRVDDPMLPKILRQAYKNSIAISAVSEADALRLKQHIFSYFESNMMQATLVVPQADQSALSLIYKSCLILTTDFTNQEQALFEVRAAAPILAKLDSYRLGRTTS